MYEEICMERHLLEKHGIAKDVSDERGTKADYYDIPEGCMTANDIIDKRRMLFNQGEVFKAAFCFNTGRHSGTDDIREINKILYYAQRVKNLLKMEEKLGL